MSRITAKGATSVLELFQTSTDASLASLVGSKYDAADGREFVLVQNAGTALASGKLVQAPATIGANHSGLTVTAYVAATTNALATVTCTLGGTVTTANQYQGGYLVVTDLTGEGQILKIAKNTAGTASGACVVTLEDAPITALDTTSKVTLTLNPYGSQNGTDFRTHGVIVCPVTLTGAVIGASFYPIAASSTTVLSYGLIQTKGVLAILNDATTAIGLDYMPSANVAGAVQTYVVATKTRVGTATVAGVDTDYALMTIQL